MRPAPKPSCRMPRPGASAEIESNCSIARGSGVSVVLEPALRHGRVQVRNRRAGTLAQRQRHRVAERIAGRLAAGGHRGRHHRAQRLERLAGAIGLREALRRDVGERAHFLDRALRRHDGQHLRELREPVPVVVLHELQRGLFEARPARLDREPRRELGEQRATIVALARLAQPLRQQQRQLEVVGVDRPRARQRVDALGILAQALVRLHQQPRGRVRLQQGERALRRRPRAAPTSSAATSFSPELQQRLLRALDFAVQRAHRGEQVVHAPGGVRPA